MTNPNELAMLLGQAGHVFHELMPHVLTVPAAHDPYVDWYKAQKACAAALVAGPPPPVQPWDQYGVNPDLELEDVQMYEGFLPMDESGATEVGRHFHGPNKYGKLTTWNGVGGGDNKHKDNTTVEDCLITEMFRWGARNYGMRRKNVRRHITYRKILDEHAEYNNPAGYGEGWAGDPWTEYCMLYDHCLFDDVDSQAIQFRQPEEPRKDGTTPYVDETDFTPGGALIVQRCLARNCSQQDGGRPSYTFSFQRSRNPVLIQDSTIDNSMQAQSRGGILVEGYEGGVYPRVAKILDSQVFLGHAQQAVGKFIDLEELVILGSHFEATGGNMWLDITGTKKVRIEGCTGNVVIKRDGQALASIEDGYVSEAA